MPKFARMACALTLSLGVLGIAPASAAGSGDVDPALTVMARTVR